MNKREAYDTLYKILGIHVVKSHIVKTEGDHVGYLIRGKDVVPHILTDRPDVVLADPSRIATSGPRAEIMKVVLLPEK